MKTRWGPLAKLDRSAMARPPERLLRRVGLDSPASTPVFRLTAGQMQMVEIAKALALDARAIIMDEPTSSLTAGESEHLFKIIAQLKAEGIAIIYISHRMEEVLKLSDRISVLRDGNTSAIFARRRPRTTDGLDDGGPHVQHAISGSTESTCGAD
jgi:ribose transport system ATP-binding protein